MSMAGDLEEDPRVKAAMAGYLGPADNLAAAQQYLQWVALELEYKAFVEGYNQAKEKYFKLEQERAERGKALDKALGDFISTLRDSFLSLSSPQTEKQS